MCNAVRDNQQRAEFVGYNVRKVRWLAFSLSAMFAGAAGSLHAINYEHIGFEICKFSTIRFGIIYGLHWWHRKLFRSNFRSNFITYLDTMLSDITEAWVLYYGIIFVLVIAFAPQGILEL